MFAEPKMQDITYLSPDCGPVLAAFPCSDHIIVFTPLPCLSGVTSADVNVVWRLCHSHSLDVTTLHLLTTGGISL